ncbi:MAG: hypothetical protein ACFFCE_01255 [Promethearchaeota archaeon]
MPCIHGLDENNCPICLVLKSTIPLKRINIKTQLFPTIHNTLYRKKKNLEKKIIDEIDLKKKNPYPPNLISKTHFINNVPNFRNKLFIERTEELDISKVDIYGISKILPLERPEWKFEKEDGNL